MGKAIYEVNLSVEPAVVEDYLAWLRPHIDEMLTLPGFESAELVAWEGDDEGWKRFTVTYKVASREDLTAYLEVHAPRMRGDGVNRFEGSFRASRRIGEHRYL